jgi:hybrid cluster-associated redox disulfide protein
MEPINLSTQSIVSDLLAQYPQFIPVMIRHRMSCVGCSMSAFETLADAARIYGLELEPLMAELTRAAAIPAPQTQPKEPLMTTPYTFFTEIAKTIETIPSESIVSRTVYRDDHLKAIVFAFAPGQELSEHTASVPAIIQIIEGECDLTLGGDSYVVKEGAWAHMPANLAHSIVARTPVKMLLLMLS